MSDHKTESEIRTLAEGTAAKLFDKSGEHATCSGDNAEYILESALRSLTPPQEPVDREALGKALFEIMKSVCGYAVICTWETTDEWRCEEYRVMAEQFALSIQKKDEVCVWSPKPMTLGRYEYSTACGAKPMFSPMGFTFCPFCSNKIQEQGGGKV